MTFTGGKNQVDQWQYDAAGDVLYDGRNRYGYDGEGQLTASGATAYVYDAEGERVMKGTVSGTTFTPSEQYLLDLGGEQVSVLDGSGNWQRTNVYAAGKLLATYDAKGTHFALSDWLGTKRMQLSAGGTMEEQCMSLPYGDGLDCSGPSPDANTHHFTGKEHDFESGLDYFGARYYGSTAGRFMIPDWSKNPQGVPYATYADPQSLNLYEYVGNNPLSRVDKDGHCVEDLCIGETIVAIDLGEALAGYLATPAGQLAIAGGAGALLQAGAHALGNIFSSKKSGTKNNARQPLLGNNPKEAGTRTNTDLPGGHGAAKKTFGKETAGQNVETGPKVGHSLAPGGKRLRLNPDGTARVDLPNRGTKPNGETIHFNDPDTKPPKPLKCGEGGACSQ